MRLGKDGRGCSEPDIEGRDHANYLSLICAAPFARSFAEERKARTDTADDLAADPRPHPARRRVQNWTTDAALDQGITVTSTVSSW